MRTISVRRLTLVLLAGTILFSNFACNRGPSRPAFNAKRCSEDALAQYDSDKDGQLSKAEIAACAGLIAALPRVDVNQDGLVSADEIAQRIDYYRNATTSVISGSCAVTLQGRPLAGADILFEPESFLGEEFHPCKGVTDGDGRAYLSRDDAEFPGLYLGFYRVRISKKKDGKELVPEKYNVQTELGFEAANDLPEVSNVIQFTL